MFHKTIYPSSKCQIVCCTTMEEAGVGEALLFGLFARCESEMCRAWKVGRRKETVDSDKLLSSSRSGNLVHLLVYQERALDSVP